MSRPTERARDAAFYADALRYTAARTAGVSGREYFETLVESLARSFEVDVVFIAEFAGSGTRVKQLVRWAHGALSEPREFDTAVTPCREVIGGHTSHYATELEASFPAEHGLQSYLGLPLREADGTVIGHMALLDRSPFTARPETWMVLETFAARASLELARQRTQDLLESLLDSVIDAILVVGPDRTIDLCNPAAERMFGGPARALRGRPVESCFDTELANLFDRYANQVEAAPGKTSVPLWVPGDRQALRADGGAFAVDVTVSPTEYGGRVFFTVVVRDVEEREAAQRTVRRLEQDNAALGEALRERFEHFLGRSAGLHALREAIDQVGPTDATVLILGETGTGKELVANAVHDASDRAGDLLVKLNCAALPHELIESELFGHEKGAFTGASQRKIGRFERADGGTLFLDEVGELPAGAQAKLLRVLQEGEVERLGASEPIKVDVRIVAATNRDLAEMVATGHFRADLYYRLAVFPIHVLPLRDRRDDIELLAMHFLDRYSRKIGKRICEIAPESLAQLKAYAWPGNVRELQNVIERATILARTDQLHVTLDAPLIGTAAATVELDSSLDGVQRRHIEDTLARTGGVIEGAAGAAAVLGIHPNTLRGRMKKLGISRQT